MTADREKYTFSRQKPGQPEKDAKLIGSASTRFVATRLMGRCFTGTVIGLYAYSHDGLAGDMTVTDFRMRAGC